MNSSDDVVDSLADRALQRMAHSVVPLESPERAAHRRERVLPGLSAFAGAAVVTRRRRRIATWALAAAVVALLFGVAARGIHWNDSSHPALASVRAVQGEVRLSRSGTAPGSVGTSRVQLLARDRVETAASSAEVTLESGAIVELDPQTRLDLGPDLPGASHDEHMELAFGKIGVRVPKLPKGRGLTISTQNAKVTVHGTAFDVIVRRVESAATTTTVSVHEGRVSVESEGREIVLGPGSNWSSSPAIESAPEESIAAAGSTAAEAPASPTRPRKSASTLGRENALFRAAIAARQGGDPERAARILDQLLTQFPDTPLAGAAKEERMRALSEAARARGASPPK
jgi:ferric-dicitrate binding protein FerR (iron transport regulator)